VRATGCSVTDEQRTALRERIGELINEAERISKLGPEEAELLEQYMVSVACCACRVVGFDFLGMAADADDKMGREHAAMRGRMVRGGTS